MQLSGLKILAQSTLSSGLITTSPHQWCNAATIPLPAARGGVIDALAVVQVRVEAGCIGVSFIDTRGNIVSPEIIAGTSKVVEIVSASTPVAICFRNVVAGVSRFRVEGCDFHWRRQWRADLRRTLPTFLKHPGEASKRAVAGEAWREVGALTGDAIALDFVKLWQSPDERVIHEATQELVALVERYDPGALGRNLAIHISRDFARKYLRQNTIRVVHLVEMLRSMDLNTGRVLEVGGAFGSFAYVLQRLGYQVTVIDRYADFHGAMDLYVALMRSAGAEIIEASRDNEVEKAAALGEYDAVISMAVVEHIPHTPRPFLEMLRSHVRPGGVLAIDTPNIARYWARKRINEGLSPYSNMADQFNSAIPFEGHHREYSREEVAWMLEAIGLEDVRTELFDYNLLQFDRIEGDHLDALLKMICDPTMADTVLGVGRKPV